VGIGRWVLPDLLPPFGFWCVGGFGEVCAYPHGRRGSGWGSSGGDRRGQVLGRREGPRLRIRRAGSVVH